MSLKNLPDDMLIRIFQYTHKLRVDKELNRIFNHQQYDIYKEKYKLIHHNSPIPDYDDIFNYLDEINKLLYYDGKSISLDFKMRL